MPTIPTIPTIPTHQRVFLTFAFSACRYTASGHVSARTDSFAFGIMAIELMTGLEARLARVVVDDR